MHAELFDTRTNIRSLTDRDNGPSLRLFKTKIGAMHSIPTFNMNIFNWVEQIHIVWQKHNEQFNLFEIKVAVRLLECRVKACTKWKLWEMEITRTHYICLIVSSSFKIKRDKKTKKLEPSDFFASLNWSGVLLKMTVSVTSLTQSFASSQHQG